MTASGEDLTASDDPTRKMMRQIAGAFADTRRPVWSPSCGTLARGNAKNWGSVKGGKHTPSCTPTSSRWPRSSAGPARRAAIGLATARSAPSSRSSVSSTSAVSRTTQRASKRCSTRKAARQPRENARVRHGFHCAQRFYVRKQRPTYCSDCCRLACGVASASHRPCADSGK